MDDSEYFAEIFEEQARRPGMSSRFLVRLMVRGECEHLFTLADLPDLLEHFDHLMPLLTHAIRDHEHQPAARRVRASAGIRVRQGRQH